MEFNEEFDLLTINKRLDFYFKDLNVVVEYDEKSHESKIEDDLVRESLIKKELNNPTIIRVKEGEESDGVIRTITTLYKKNIKK